MKNEKLYQIILAPHVTEKSSRLTDDKQLVFKVSRDATKKEIKKAVELLLDAKVTSVNTIIVKGKKKRFGLRQGQRKDYKKAYVVLHKDVDIDALLAQQA